MSINNSGLLTKTTTTGESNWQAQLNNTGIVQIHTGTFASGIYSQSAGETSVLAGAKLVFQSLNLQGGTLTGNGTVDANVNNVQATVHPGLNGIGTLTIDGNYTQNSGGVFFVEIDDNGTGADFDRLIVTGTIQLSDAVLDWSGSQVTDPSAGPLTILDNRGSSSISGLFRTADGRSLVSGDSVIISGFSYQIFYNQGTGNDVVLALDNSQFDYGDAPASYGTLTADGGARHVAIGPQLGLLRDGETDGVPTSLADGDDLADSDDEDGVAFGELQIGKTGTITVNVQNAPEGAYLTAWIDFNQNGTWEEGERIVNHQFVTQGDNTLTLNPATFSSLTGETFARFRLVSTDDDLQPTSTAINGEVEDYRVTILPDPAPIPQDDAILVAEDTISTLAPLQNDVAPDDSALSLVAINGTPVVAGQTVALANGSLLVNADNTLAFTPATNFHGGITFGYTVSNATGTTAEGTVFLTVTPVNDPPTLTEALDLQIGRVGEAFTFTIPTTTFVDVDGEALAYAVRFADGNPLPAWLSFDSASRTLSGTPPEVAWLQLEITAIDPAGESVSTDLFLDIRQGQIATTFVEGTNFLFGDLTRWAASFNPANGGSVDLPVLPDDLSELFDLATALTPITAGLPTPPDRLQELDLIATETLAAFRQELEDAGLEVLLFPDVSNEELRVRYTTTISRVGQAEYDSSTTGLLEALALSANLTGNVAYQGDLHFTLTLGVDANGFYLLGESSVALNVGGSGSLSGSFSLPVGNLGISATGTANAEADVVLSGQTANAKYRLSDLAGDPLSFLSTTVDASVTVGLSQELTPLGVDWDGFWTLPVIDGELGTLASEIDWPTPDEFLTSVLPTFGDELNSLLTGDLAGLLSSTELPLQIGEGFSLAALDLPALASQSLGLDVLGEIASNLLNELASRGVTIESELTAQDIINLLSGQTTNLPELLTLRLENNPLDFTPLSTPFSGGTDQLGGIPGAAFTGTLTADVRPDFDWGIGFDATGFFLTADSSIRSPIDLTGALSGTLGPLTGTANVTGHVLPVVSLAGADANGDGKIRPEEFFANLSGLELDLVEDPSVTFAVQGSVGFGELIDSQTEAPFTVEFAGQIDTASGNWTLASTNTENRVLGIGGGLELTNFTATLSGISEAGGTTVLVGAFQAQLVLPGTGSELIAPATIDVTGTFNENGFSIAGQAELNDLVLGTDPALLWIDEGTALVNLIVDRSAANRITGGVEFTGLSLVVLPEIPAGNFTGLPEGLITLVNAQASFDHAGRFHLAVDQAELDVSEAVHITASRGNGTQAPPALMLDFDPNASGSSNTPIASLRNLEVVLPEFSELPPGELGELIITRNGFSFAGLVLGGNDFDVMLGNGIQMEDFQIELAGQFVLTPERRFDLDAIATGSRLDIFPDGPVAISVTDDNPNDTLSAFRADVVLGAGTWEFDLRKVDGTLGELLQFSAAPTSMQPAASLSYNVNAEASEPLLSLPNLTVTVPLLATGNEAPAATITGFTLRHGGGVELDSISFVDPGDAFAKELGIAGLVPVRVHSLEADFAERPNGTVDVNEIFLTAGLTIDTAGLENKLGTLLAAEPIITVQRYEVIDGNTVFTDLSNGGNLTARLHVENDLETGPHLHLVNLPGLEVGLDDFQIDLAGQVLDLSGTLTIPPLDTKGVAQQLPADLIPSELTGLSPLHAVLDLSSDLGDDLSGDVVVGGQLARRADGSSRLTFQGQATLDGDLTGSGGSVSGTTTAGFRWDLLSTPQPDGSLTFSGQPELIGIGVENLELEIADFVRITVEAAQIDFQAQPGEAVATASQAQITFLHPAFQNLTATVDQVELFDDLGNDGVLDGFAFQNFTLDNQADPLSIGPDNLLLLQNWALTIPNLTYRAGDSSVQGEIEFLGDISLNVPGVEVSATNLRVFTERRILNPVTAPNDVSWDFLATADTLTLGVGDATASGQKLFTVTVDAPRLLFDGDEATDILDSSNVNLAFGIAPLTGLGFTLVATENNANKAFRFNRIGGETKIGLGSLQLNNPNGGNVLATLGLDGIVPFEIYEATLDFTQTSVENYTTLAEFEASVEVGLDLSLLEDLGLTTTLTLGGTPLAEGRTSPGIHPSETTGHYAVDLAFDLSADATYPVVPVFQDLKIEVSGFELGGLEFAGEIELAGYRLDENNNIIALAYSETENLLIDTHEDANPVQEGLQVGVQTRFHLDVETARFDGVITSEGFRLGGQARLKDVALGNDPALLWIDEATVTVDFDMTKSATPNTPPTITGSIELTNGTFVVWPELPASENTLPAGVITLVETDARIDHTGRFQLSANAASIMLGDVLTASATAITDEQGNVIVEEGTALVAIDLDLQPGSTGNPSEVIATLRNLNVTLPQLSTEFTGHLDKLQVTRSGFSFSNLVIGGPGANIIVDDVLSLRDLELVVNGSLTILPQQTYTLEATATGTGLDIFPDGPVSLSVTDDDLFDTLPAFEAHIDLAAGVYELGLRKVEAELGDFLHLEALPLDNQPGAEFTYNSNGKADDILLSLGNLVATLPVLAVGEDIPTLSITGRTETIDGETVDIPAFAMRHDGGILLETITFTPPAGGNFSRQLGIAGIVPLQLSEMKLDFDEHPDGTIDVAQGTLTATATVNTTGLEQALGELLGNDPLVTPEITVEKYEIIEDELVLTDLSNDGTLTATLTYDATAETGPRISLVDVPGLRLGITNFQFGVGEDSILLAGDVTLPATNEQGVLVTLPLGLVPEVLRPEDAPAPQAVFQMTASSGDFAGTILVGGSLSQLANGGSQMNLQGQASLTASGETLSGTVTGDFQWELTTTPQADGRLAFSGQPELVGLQVSDLEFFIDGLAKLTVDSGEINFNPTEGEAYATVEKAQLEFLVDALQGVNVEVGRVQLFDDFGDDGKIDGFLIESLIASQSTPLSLGPNDLLRLETWNINVPNFVYRPHFNGGEFAGSIAYNSNNVSLRLPGDVEVTTTNLTVSLERREIESENPEEPDAVVWEFLATAEKLTLGMGGDAANSLFEVTLTDAELRIDNNSATDILRVKKNASLEFGEGAGPLAGVSFNLSATQANDGEAFRFNILDSQPLFGLGTLSVQTADNQGLLTSFGLAGILPFDIDFAELTFTESLANGYTDLEAFTVSVAGSFDFSKFEDYFTPTLMIGSNDPHIQDLGKDRFSLEVLFDFSEDAQFPVVPLFQDLQFGISGIELAGFEFGGSLHIAGYRIDENGDIKTLAYRESDGAIVDSLNPSDDQVQLRLKIQNEDSTESGPGLAQGNLEAIEIQLSGSILQNSQDETATLSLDGAVIIEGEASLGGLLTVNSFGASGFVELAINQSDLSVNSFDFGLTDIRTKGISLGLGDYFQVGITGTEGGIDGNPATQEDNGYVALNFQKGQPLTSPLNATIGSPIFGLSGELKDLQLLEGGTPDFSGIRSVGLSLEPNSILDTLQKWFLPVTVNQVKLEVQDGFFEPGSTGRLSTIDPLAIELVIDGAFGLPGLISEALGEDLQVAASVDFAGLRLDIDRLRDRLVDLFEDANDVLANFSIAPGQAAVDAFREFVTTETTATIVNTVQTAVGHYLDESGIELPFTVFELGEVIDISQLNSLGLELGIDSGDSFSATGAFTIGKADANKQDDSPVDDIYYLAISGELKLSGYGGGGTLLITTAGPVAATISGSPFIYEINTGITIGGVGSIVFGANLLDGVDTTQAVVNPANIPTPEDWDLTDRTQIEDILQGFWDADAGAIQSLWNLPATVSLSGTLSDLYVAGLVSLEGTFAASIPSLFGDSQGNDPGLALIGKGSLNVVGMPLGTAGVLLDLTDPLAPAFSFGVAAPPEGNPLAFLFPVQANLAGTLRTDGMLEAAVLAISSLIGGTVESAADAAVDSLGAVITCLVNDLEQSRLAAISKIEVGDPLPETIGNRLFDTLELPVDQQVTFPAIKTRLLSLLDWQNGNPATALATASSVLNAFLTEVQTVITLSLPVESFPAADPTIIDADERLADLVRQKAAFFGQQQQLFKNIIGQGVTKYFGDFLTNATHRAAEGLSAAFEAFNPTFLVSGAIQPTVFGFALGDPTDQVDLVINKNQITLDLTTTNFLPKLLSVVPPLGGTLTALGQLTGISDRFEIGLTAPLPGTFFEALLDSNVNLTDVLGDALNPFTGWEASLAGSMSFLGIEVADISGIIFGPQIGNELHDPDNPEAGTTLFLKNVHSFGLSDETELTAKNTGLPEGHENEIPVYFESDYQNMLEYGGLLITGQLKIPDLLRDPQAVFNQLKTETENLDERLNGEDGPLTDLLDDNFDLFGDTPQALAAFEEAKDYLGRVISLLTGAAPLGTLQVYVPSPATLVDEFLNFALPNVVGPGTDSDGEKQAATIPGGLQFSDLNSNGIYDLAIDVLVSGEGSSQIVWADRIDPQTSLGDLQFISGEDVPVDASRIANASLLTLTEVFADEGDGFLTPAATSAFDSEASLGFVDLNRNGKLDWSGDQNTGNITFLEPLVDPLTGEKADVASLPNLVVYLVDPDQAEKKYTDNRLVGLNEGFLDANGNGRFDMGTDVLYDLNGNDQPNGELWIDADADGRYTSPEHYRDLSGNGQYDVDGNPAEPFTDLNGNEIWDAGDGLLDLGNGLYNGATESVFTIDAAQDQIVELASAFYVDGFVDLQLLGIHLGLGRLTLEDGRMKIHVSSGSVGTDLAIGLGLNEVNAGEAITLLSNNPFFSTFEGVFTTLIPEPLQSQATPLDYLTTIAGDFSFPLPVASLDAQFDLQVLKDWLSDSFGPDSLITFPIPEQLDSASSLQPTARVELFSPGYTDTPPVHPTANPQDLRYLASSPWMLDEIQTHGGVRISATLDIPGLAEGVGGIFETQFPTPPASNEPTNERSPLFDPNFRFLAHADQLAIPGLTDAFAGLGVDSLLSLDDFLITLSHQDGDVFAHLDGKLSLMDHEAFVAQGTLQYIDGGFAGTLTVTIPENDQLILKSANGQTLFELNGALSVSINTTGDEVVLENGETLPAQSFVELDGKLIFGGFELVGSFDFSAGSDFNAVSLAVDASTKFFNTNLDVEGTLDINRNPESLFGFDIEGSLNVVYDTGNPLSVELFASAFSGNTRTSFIENAVVALDFALDSEGETFVDFGINGDLQLLGLAEPLAVTGNFTANANDAALDGKLAILIPENAPVPLLTTNNVVTISGVVELTASFGRNRSNSVKLSAAGANLNLGSLTTLTIDSLTIDSIGNITAQLADPEEFGVGQYLLDLPSIAFYANWFSPRFSLSIGSASFNAPFLENKLTFSGFTFYSDGDFRATLASAHNMSFGLFTLNAGLELVGDQNGIWLEVVAPPGSSGSQPLQFTVDDATGGTLVDLRTEEFRINANNGTISDLTGNAISGTLQQFGKPGVLEVVDASVLLKKGSGFGEFTFQISSGKLSLLGGPEISLPTLSFRQDGVREGFSFTRTLSLDSLLNRLGDFSTLIVDQVDGLTRSLNLDLQLTDSGLELSQISPVTITTPFGRPQLANLRVNTGGDLDFDLSGRLSLLELFDLNAKFEVRISGHGSQITVLKPSTNTPIQLLVGSVVDVTVEEFRIKSDGTLTDLNGNSITATINQFGNDWLAIQDASIEIFNNPSAVGIQYRYYEGASGNPVSQGISYDMDLSERGSRTSGFSIEYTTHRYFSSAGTYEFRTRDDYSSYLIIDGQTVVENSSGVTTSSGSINLAEGFHEIVVGYAASPVNSRFNNPMLLVEFRSANSFFWHEIQTSLFVNPSLFVGKPQLQFRFSGADLKLPTGTTIPLPALTFDTKGGLSTNLGDGVLGATLGKLFGNSAFAGLNVTQSGHFEMSLEANGLNFSLADGKTIPLTVFGSGLTITHLDIRGTNQFSADIEGTLRFPTFENKSYPIAKADLSLDYGSGGFRFEINDGQFQLPFGKSVPMSGWISLGSRLDFELTGSIPLAGNAYPGSAVTYKITENGLQISGSPLGTNFSGGFRITATGHLEITLNGEEVLIPLPFSSGTGSGYVLPSLNKIWKDAGGISANVFNKAVGFLDDLISSGTKTLKTGARTAANTYRNINQGVKSFVGGLINGYVSDAVVFLDVNGNFQPDYRDENQNGQYDAGEWIEPLTISDIDGRFELAIPESFDLNGNGEIDPDEGSVIAYEGINTYTGFAMTTPLAGYFQNGEAILTPVTTLIHALATAGELPLTEAIERVRNHFELSAEADLLGTDSLAAIGMGEPYSEEILQLHELIAVTVTQITALLPEETEILTRGSTIYVTLAERIFNPPADAPFDLTNPIDVADLINRVLARQDVKLSEDISEAAAEVISEINGTVLSIDPREELSYLRELKQIETVAAGYLFENLKQLRSETISPEDFLAENTPEALQTEIEGTPTPSDEPAIIQILNSSQVEDEGPLRFTVTLDRAIDASIVLDYVLQAGTAEGSDAELVAGQVTIRANTTSATIEVNLVADDRPEFDEHFFVTLSNPEANGRAVLIADADAQGTIQNDDGISEGQSVSLSGPLAALGVGADQTLVIDWGDSTTSPATVDETAGTYTASHHYLDDDPTGTVADLYTFRAIIVENQQETILATGDLPVVNVAPVILSVNAPVITENGIATLTGTYSDVGVRDTHEIEIEWGDGTTSNAVIDPLTRSFVAAHQYLDDNPTNTSSDIYSIFVRIRDDDGGEATASTSGIVENAPPQILNLTSNHSSILDVSYDGSIKIEAGIFDPGTQDTHTVMVDWGDGSTMETIPVDPSTKTLQSDHTYSQAGVYSIIVTVLDDDGGISTESTTGIVQGIGLVDGTLFIIGTDARDHITLKSAKGRKHQPPQIEVDAKFRQGRNQIKQSETFNADAIDLVYVLLGNGDDHYLGQIPFSQFVDGGSGDDLIQGGTGSDILIGGTGNDVIHSRGGDDILSGGDGHDLLLGGNGAEILLGGHGNDLLFGGNGQDLLFGGKGVDAIFGKRGNDWLIGGSNWDLLHGGLGNDQIDRDSPPVVEILENLTTEELLESLDTNFADWISSELAEALDALGSRNL